MARRRARRLSASFARPRQARPDRGERSRPALRRRGGLVPRVRASACTARTRRCRPSRPGSSATALHRELRARPRTARAAELAQAHRRAAIWSRRTRSTRSPRRSASTRRACATACSGTTASPRPASTRTSARARPTSTATTAIRDHEPNPCLGPIATPPYLRDGGLSEHARLKRRAEDRRGRPRAVGNGAPIAGLYACGNDMASIMRGNIRGRASRSARAWCSPIAPRWRSARQKYKGGSIWVEAIAATAVRSLSRWGEGWGEGNSDSRWPTHHPDRGGCHRAALRADPLAIRPLPLGEVNGVRGTVRFHIVGSVCSRTVSPASSRSFCLLDRLPHPIRRARRVDVADA